MNKTSSIEEANKRVTFLGKKLKQFRETSGLTRSQLAEQLGVDVRIIYDYEDGFKTPRINKIIALAHIFGVSLDSLFSE